MLKTMKTKVILIIVAVVAMMILTACDAKMSSNAEDYVGKNYDDVVAEFNEMGFNNIADNKIEDLTSAGPQADGYVESVSVAGNDKFKVGDTFEKGSEVAITYHSIRKLTPPVGADELVGMDYSEISAKFLDQGFINVNTEEVYDLDPDTTKEDHVNEVLIGDVSSFSTTDEYPFDINVLVKCHYPYSKYKANIKVEFKPNLIFDKYDIEFAIDDDSQGTHEHGKDWSDEIELKEGEHTLMFVSADDPSIRGEKKLNVSSDLEAAYEISCKTEKVKVVEKYVDRQIELADNQLKMTCAESKYKGKKYQEVVKHLKKLGFENVEEKPIYDIIFFESSVGDTESVTIDGSRKYRRGDVFNKDVKVIVKYHMMEEDDPKIKEEEEKQKAAKKEITDQVLGKTCDVARKAVKEKGYTATYTFEGTYSDFTDYIANYGPDNEVKEYVVTEVASVDIDAKTIDLFISSKQKLKEEKEKSAKQKKLEEYIGATEAWGALHQRLNEEFPYGWKRTRSLAETPVDEKTWFLKWEVKVKDSNKNKVNVTVEAKIKGPGSNPTITSFYYY